SVRSVTIRLPAMWPTPTSTNRVWPSISASRTRNSPDESVNDDGIGVDSVAGNTRDPVNDISTPPTNVRPSGSGAPSVVSDRPATSIGRASGVAPAGTVTDSPVGAVSTAPADPTMGITGATSAGA